MRRLGCKWRQASDGRTRDLVNPANEDVIGQVPLCSDDDLSEAIEAAERGFEVWKNKTANERYAIMMKAAALIEERKDAKQYQYSTGVGTAYGRPPRPSRSCQG